jgi:hypothetical protein
MRIGGVVPLNPGRIEPSRRTKPRGWFARCRAGCLIDGAHAASVCFATVQPIRDHGSPGQRGMSDMEQAVERLDRALDRLEASLTAALARGSSSEALASELASAKRHYAALAKTTDEVGAKLDKAIGRLKFVLES